MKKVVFRFLIGFTFILAITMASTYVINKNNPFHELLLYFKQLYNLDFGHYRPRFVYNKEYSVFPDLLNSYWHSIKLLTIGLAIGILLGLILSILLLYVKKQRRKSIIFLNYLFLSFPDFMLILVLQAGVILIYMKTGVLLGNVLSTWGNQAILLPIISLSLFPTVFTIRISINTFQEVFSQKYILLAYSKGLKKSEIIFRHVLKNSLPTILANMPHILQMTISNLFIVEILFNVRGIMYFLYNNGSSIETILPSLLLIWLTYFVAQNIIQHIAPFWRKEGLDV